jgi:hypothetical protein
LRYKPFDKGLRVMCIINTKLFPVDTKKTGEKEMVNTTHRRIAQLTKAINMISIR